MKDLAIEKIKKELALIKGDRYVEVVKKPTAEALIEFCKQDAEFAQAVVQQDKSLGECLKSIMSGCGNGISDITVYRKAVQFYFPGADVRMKMTVDLCASVNSGADDAASEEPTKAPDVGITLDLTDFL
ncbi:MAG: Cas9 inhibitor AcrIIA9 family protein [Oscillospiraceae bacterium]|nr:Cas9 inhibitor AcrIIA9 family protein [Oscillospiraceae bacterium]